MSSEPYTYVICIIPEDKIKENAPDEYKRFYDTLDTLQISPYEFSRFKETGDSEYLTENLPPDNYDNIVASIENYTARINISFDNMLGTFSEKTGVDIYMKSIDGDSGLDVEIDDGYCFASLIELDKKLINVGASLITYTNEG